MSNIDLERLLPSTGNLITKRRETEADGLPKFIHSMKITGVLKKKRACWGDKLETSDSVL